MAPYGLFGCAKAWNATGGNFDIGNAFERRHCPRHVFRHANRRRADVRELNKAARAALKRDLRDRIND